MLPFDRKPWAPRVAKLVIVFTILAEVAAVLWLRRLGPLDTGEIVALLLVLIGVIPPNVHVIRRRPDEQLEEYMTEPRSRKLFPSRSRRST